MVNIHFGFFCLSLFSWLDHYLLLKNRDSFSGTAPKCLTQGRAMVIDTHTSPPDMELSKCAWFPLRWKQEAPSRQGYLSRAPWRGEHPPGRPEHMVYTFLQRHKPREWTGNEGKEMAIIKHYNLHSDCLSQSVLPADLWVGNMTSIPQMRKPHFKEAKLLIYILQWILVMLEVKLRSEEYRHLHSCHLNPQWARQFPSNFRPVHFKTFSTHSAFSSPLSS